MKKTQSVINVYYDKLFVGIANVNFHWEAEPKKMEIMLNPSSALMEEEFYINNGGFFIIEEEMSNDLEVQQQALLKSHIASMIGNFESSKFKVKVLLESVSTLINNVEFIITKEFKAEGVKMTAHNKMTGEIKSLPQDCSVEEIHEILK
ncbi:MAG: hypothetical protein RB294_11490 [Bacteroidales bacterium]|jgi:hypothetical protein|nr:hypothetical protein [Bacteroidales bacterium]